MKKNNLIVFILAITIQYSCQSELKIVNSVKDKKGLDSVINKFYALEKDKNYIAMAELFTNGDSKFTKKELQSQLIKIFEETQAKNGDVIRIISKDYQTEIKTNGKDSVGFYQALIDNERKLVLSRESFKMMLEMNKIKIYDYHIATKAK